MRCLAKNELITSLGIYSSSCNLKHVHHNPTAVLSGMNFIGPMGWVQTMHSFSN